MKPKRKQFLFLLALLASCIFFSTTALARAGGGGSGGGGSGGSGGGSSGGSHHTGTSTRRTSPLESLINTVIFATIAGGSTIIFTYRSRKARRKSLKLMKAYKKLGVNWDYKEIQKYVEDAYFVIQESWRRYDPDYAQGYLSETLIKEWKSKLAWIKIRNEEIVQKNVQLLSAVPVGVHDEVGEDHDQIWYLIHGKMIGYYRDKNTMRVVRGNPKTEAFYEYWLFVRENGRWVLHEIRQQNEMDIREFSED